MKMYTRLTLIALLFLSFALPKSLFGAVDEEEMKAKLPMMMGQNNVGKDYWFTIPPCYEDESAGYDNFVKVLVTSPVATKVTVEVPGKGYFQTKTTLANGVIEFKLTPTEAQAILHSGISNKARPAKVYKDAGVHVFSDAPVVVYVVVRYHYTSDGFLAIPTAAFGTAYINMVYKEPDIYSAGYFMAPFTGVTAAYDNTQVSFTMGGGDEGDDQVPLDGGRKLRTGETATEYLDKGDVWLLSIQDVRQDLSGSRIVGNKPFSIVSGIHCANFPLAVYACDYTVEMELPIYTWGKQYYVAPKKGRKFNGIIRIYASEDDTEIFRDNSYIGTLRKGGGGAMGIAYHEMRVWPQYDDFGKAIPPRIATITANKPISIMYYNTGTSEDGNPAPITDPYMMVMTPIEQFQTEIYFPSPNATGGKDGFLENSMTLVFELDNGVMPQDLMFAEMSRTGAPPQWISVAAKFGAGFEEFVVPYKGKKYAKTELSLGAEGVYGIRSDSTKFAAYSHGAGSYDSYGFPTSAALNDLTIPDTNAPVPTYVQTCDGDVLKDKGIVTDMPNDDAFRSNMSDLYLIENLNNNYDFGWRTQSGEFIPGQQRTLSWWLTVVDKKKAARATIYFTDRAGNDTTITIEYNPPEYEVVSGNDFGVVAETGGPVFLQDTIRNLSTKTPLYVTRVELKNKNQGFTIDSYTPNTWTPGMQIGIGEEVIVTIKFDPLIAKPLNKPIYLDSLGIGYGDATFAECGFFFETEQKGFLGASIIEVSDWTFPDKNINDANRDQHIISITNKGDQDLKVYGIKQDLTVPEFTHNFNTLYPTISAATPLVIAPGKSETFTAYFKPTAEQTYTDRIVFSSNAGNNIDSICLLGGKGISSKVSVAGANWQAYLIDRTTFSAGPYDVESITGHRGFKLTNIGKPEDNVIARVVEAYIVNQTPNASKYFKVGNENIFDYIKTKVINQNIPSGSTIEEDVVFQPAEIGLHSIEIALVFNNAVGGDTLFVSYTGTGLVPNMKVSDITYGNMLINDEAGAQTGQFMQIINDGTIDFGYKLTIKNITVVTNANDVSDVITDFQGKTFRYDRTLIPVNTELAIGDTLRIPVDFVARINGLNTASVEIETNANKDEVNYDDRSDWIGEGYAVGITVIPDGGFPCISDAPVNYTVYIRNTTTNTITLDSLGLSPRDLNNDQINDLTITGVSGLVIAPGDSIQVTVNYDPSGTSAAKDIALIVYHGYGAILTVTGDKTALNIGSKALTGKTITNVTGATIDRNANPPRFMVSLGDKFDYEIDFQGDATTADVFEFTVNVDFNKFYLQPLFGDELENILLGANMQIKPNTFAISNNSANTQLGSQTISFTVIPKVPNTPILTTSANIVKLPFLVVLPADSEIFDPTKVKTGKDNLGVFDMSHKITGFDGCYTNTSDFVEVGINEICSGTLRMLFIGDLDGQSPQIAPNPVGSGGGTLEYSVPFDQQGEIEIYNSTMQKVATLFDGKMTQGRQSVDLPVSQLANGAYYFKITMGQKQEMGRLIIQK